MAGAVFTFVLLTPSKRSLRASAGLLHVSAVEGGSVGWLWPSFAGEVGVILTKATSSWQLSRPRTIQFGKSWWFWDPSLPDACHTCHTR